MKIENKVRDPVCEMDVSSGNYDSNYLGVDYSFCSKQCHDRFVTNPHLYIGKPGHPSPKQLGQSVIKCRTMKLDRAIPEDISEKLDTALSTMMGIRDITFEDNVIRITYDLLEATVEQIEDEILKTDKSLSLSWMEKIRSAFIHYVEETEIMNLEEDTPDNHCNKL